jgi:hypothetical protein
MRPLIVGSMSRVQRSAHSDVIVAPDVAKEFKQLYQSNRRAADATQEAMADIPHRREPIELHVPGDDPGTRYYAAVPDDTFAPVPIYRRARDDEEGADWAVVVLFPGVAYQRYRADPERHQLSSTATTSADTPRTDRDS